MNRTKKTKTISITAKIPASHPTGCRCDPEDLGGLFFVIQALPPRGEPFNAMVLVTDVQLEELEKAHATVPHVDKRALAATSLLRALGLPEDLVVGAKCILDVFESETEAREAIARNRAANAQFARLASGIPEQRSSCHLN